MKNIVDEKYILLLGGTGAMGVHIVNLFNNMGIKCVVTSRKNQIDNGNITYVKGDAHDDIFLEELLKKRKWFAIIDFMLYTTEQFRLRVSRLLSATSQYVFISSARVYADSDTAITEDSPRLLDVCKDKDYLETDEYALAKARQEDILRENGNNWTIVRPYVTFSETRLQLSSIEKEGWLFRALNGQTIVFSRDLADKYTTFTYGLDVARGICALIGQETALGEAFHITVSESYKWSEILDIYLTSIEKKLGYRPNVLLTDEWKAFYGGTKEQMLYDRLYNRRFDNTKISKYIDVKAFQGTTLSINRCIEAFIEHPQFLPINYANEARRDCLTHEWTPFAKISGVKAKVKYLLIRLKLLK